MSAPAALGLVAVSWYAASLYRWRASLRSMCAAVNPHGARRAMQHHACSVSVVTAELVRVSGFDCDMKLYVLRHGETSYNRLRLCNDDPNRDVHLTDAGIAQAQAAAQQLRDTPLQRILTSQLPRTRQTAEIINRYHRVPVEPHALLNDIRSGFDGQPVSDYFAAIAHDPLHARANGGESLLDYKARVMRFIEWLKMQPQDCVLVVAHEETLRVFAAWCRGVPDSGLRNLQFANCALQRYRL